MKSGNSRSRRKAKTGSVKVRNSNNRLQLVFTLAGKRHFVSLGLTDTPLNRKLAQDKAFEVQRDIEYGEFDATYQKYKPQKTSEENDPLTQHSSQLIALWERYVEYLKPTASPKTIDGTYNPVTAHIRKCKTDGLKDALKFRRELLKVTTTSQARRTLMQLSAACKWGMQHRLVTENPFEGMYQALDASKPVPPVAYSAEERDLIIAAFDSHDGKGMTYQHYAPFVKFLFWTGCRPCEAIGLRWGSIVDDCSKIHFHESIVEVSGKKIRRTETKTSVKRWFSCPKRLQKLLQSIRSDDIDPNELVFKSPKNGIIGERNFRQRGWAKVVSSIGLDVKDGVTMTPYNCRDTFITLQALAGHSSTTIARWVGNSSKVIEERYLDKLKMDELKPTDV
ncbi:Integrase [Leptolyngbya sp. PCC 7375]|nr:Integrase [Leptolyngbya sp. PCC 7375]